MESYRKPWNESVSDLEVELHQESVVDQVEWLVM